MNYLILAILFAQVARGQDTGITGNVQDQKTHLPMQGVTVYLMPGAQTTCSNKAGDFTFRSVGILQSIMITAIGYATRTISYSDFLAAHNIVFLEAASIELSAVTISARPGEQFHVISKIDLSVRDISNSQEALRLVPGLIIGQHQGGGKAEQIFLRGFDCDHGTDISINADGIPVNMVSHAHGQGYADNHFIIPETIGNVNFNKGPYYSERGDFCTSGYVDFHTINSPPRNEVKLEGGMFNTFRALAMVNLLNENAKAKQQSWWVASEFRYSDSYFDNPQAFRRFNVFTKYNGHVSRQTWLDLSASTFYSKWNASGQIPERSVAEGLIGFFGSLDPNEGGSTSRTNLNAQTLTTLANGDVINNQLYWSYYTFNLYSNFTFFLKDSLNGDEIHQQEARNLFGYKGNYEHIGYIGNTRVTTEAGLQIRGDLTNNSALSHTKDRSILLEKNKLGDISEFSISPYLNETFRFSDHFSMNAGLRFDEFSYSYNNKLPTDTFYSGTGKYTTNDHSLNPKLSFYYIARDNLEFYLNLGKGFHSNDTRSVVAEKGGLSQPGAYGADLGTVLKPAKQLIINAALWYIMLEQENVYGGDGGTIEFSGQTQRYGFDMSVRYKAARFLFFDLDLNYAHGRSVNSPKGHAYIPLAPVLTSTGGITLSRQKGLNGSLRYRYMTDRPANVNYSLTALGYFVTDFLLNYTMKKYEFGIAISNLMNVKWKETQFATETRLKGEPTPATDICFTPGTPFAARLMMSYYF